MSLLWVGKRVDQKAEGGLMQKRQRSLLKVGGHGFLVEPHTGEYIMDTTATRQSRQGP